MTGESDEEGIEKTVKWVADKGVTYGYAYDEDLELFGQLGLSYFPSAVLVDPFGNVVYTGHPSELSEKRQIVAISKADAFPDFSGVDLSKIQNHPNVSKVFKISSVSKHNLTEVLYALYELISRKDSN